MITADRLPMSNSISLPRALAVVFIASACTMVIELVASRIIAPYTGVSIYTWTGIIGVVLAGIGLGNFLGGKVGDRFPSPLALSAILFAGSFLSLAILPLTALLKSALLPAGIHLMGRVTIYTFALFFTPATALGMVTPVVIRLTLKDLGKTAGVAGTVYAVSCAGSILGTFLTGFYLVSAFGTRAVVWQVAGVLLLVGLFGSGLWRSRLKFCLAVLTLAAFSAAFQHRSSFQVPYVKESNYYAISIVDSVVRGRDVKTLILDHLAHSFVDPNDPGFHGYPYEETFAGAARYAVRDKAGMSALLIGGGGYSFARYMEAAYPAGRIEVVEIDPAVTRVAYSRLGLSASTRIITYNADARVFLLDRKPAARYDLVVCDAFNDLSVPYHLTTLEFNEMVKAALTPDGFYVVNLVDNLRDGRFVRSFMKTLGGSFESVYLYRGSTGWGTSSSDHVVLATNRSFDRAELVLHAGDDAGGPGSGTWVTLGEVEDALGWSLAVILTDDYVPVDNMLAPVFARK